MRATTAFSRLLRLGKGVLVKRVDIGSDRVVVEVALRRRRLICPECGYSTRARKDTRPVDSVWRHLDLGVWRLEIHCRRRRLWCPVHGARTEGEHILGDLYARARGHSLNTPLLEVALTHVQAYEARRARR